MHINTLAALAAFAVAAAAPSLATAADERGGRTARAWPRQPHIAVDDRRLWSSRCPADIVGFEHDATTDDQKAAAGEGEGAARAAALRVQAAGGGGIAVADAKVELQAEHHHDGDAVDDHDQAAGADHEREGTKVTRNST